MEDEKDLLAEMDVDAEHFVKTRMLTTGAQARGIRPFQLIVGCVLVVSIRQLAQGESLVFFLFGTEGVSLFFHFRVDLY